MPLALSKKTDQELVDLKKSLEKSSDAATNFYSYVRLRQEFYLVKYVMKKRGLQDE